MNYYDIGQRIRKYRKACNMSQDELAEKVGISVTHMSHIETGNTKLSLNVLVSLALELNVRTDDLLFEPSKSSAAANLEQISSLLAGCSAKQLSIITDIIQAAKISINKYLD